MLLSYGYGTVLKSWKVIDNKPPGYVRMYYVLGGDVVYESETEWKKLKKGMLYCFPNTVPYKITHDPENRLRCLHLEANIAPFVVSALQEVDVSEHPVLKKILEAFIELKKGNTLPLTNPLPQELLQAVIEYLKNIRVLEPVDLKIEKAVLYIQEHIDQPISIEELSAYCGYHPQYFIRLFKECMGLTPHQFIIGSRMKNAVLMLGDGLTVAKTAETLGYKESKNFSRTFKQIYGISPKEVKKNSDLLI